MGAEIRVGMCWCRCVGVEVVGCRNACGGNEQPTGVDDGHCNLRFHSKVIKIGVKNCENQVLHRIVATATN